jgi:two-component system sensor histidine kinase/response regulator
MADALPLPLVMLTHDGAPWVLDSLLHGAAWRAMSPAADGLRAAPSRASRPAPPPPELAGARVLLAEDNPINQEVARGLLDHAGVVTDVAADGVAALRLVRERHYDAVLMDMQMPVMDGIAAASAIRALPEHASLPIIAMTASALDQDRERCMAAGMNDHLSKPIDPTLLWQTLLRWTRRDAATMLAAAPAPAASAPAEAPLPSGIAGLDVDEALNRLGGRTGLYLSVLKMFIANHHNTAGQIQAALQQGRRPEGMRLAHTLRGAAASIGARELSEAAAGLEVALASQVPMAAIEPKLLRLGSRLDALVTALQRQLA